MCRVCLQHLDLHRTYKELQLLGLDCECSRDQEDAGAVGAGTVCFEFENLEAFDASGKIV